MKNITPTSSPDNRDDKTIKIDFRMNPYRIMKIHKLAEVTNDTIENAISSLIISRFE